MFGSMPGWQGVPGQTSPLLDPDLVGGIAAYRRHPWQRDLPEPPSIWREGATRLLDYAPPASATRPARRRRQPPRLLFVPSLVNRGYVLDLAPGRSMLRWFAQEGFRPLLLEWDAPDEAARHFTLTDYIAGRLERALAACGAPVVLVGYCMGGLLAIAAALRRPEHVAGLVLLAVPWDFHAAGRELPLRLAATLPALEPAMALRGTLPVDALQALFALADADGIAARYRGFARLDPDSERARAFVALEDWLSDGVALSAPVARECLGDWYGRNTPGRLAWRVAGEVVDPARLRLPSFVALPGRDRIVPPATAQTLADLIPGAVAHRPAAGHIGMAAGSSAETALWQPLARWLRGLQGGAARRR
jgi:poly(3-hydroxyalkanoate) synthetase